MKKRYVLIATLIVALCAMSLSVSGSMAAPLAVHSVWSQKPLYVLDATTGVTYTATSGNAVASWTTEPLASGDRGFYDAIIYANGTRYEFRLVQFGTSTPDLIKGQYDIYKNNVLVASVQGVVVGLSQPIGGIHKFTNISGTWGLAGAITNRTSF